MVNWITSFIDRKKFFASEPDVHLIIYTSDVFNFGINRDRVSTISSVLLSLNSAKVTYEVYFLNDLSNCSLLGNEEVFRWLFDMFYVKLNKGKMNFIFSYDFVINNPQFVNEFFNYFSKQMVVGRERASKVVGRVVCNKIGQFRDVLLNIGLTERFDILYLVSYEDCSLDFSRLREEFTALTKDRVFSFHIDYDFNFIKTGKLSNYFSFLKNFLVFYLEDLIKSGCRIWTFDNMLSLKGAHCFAGDCIKNNFIIDFSGNVFLCLKSVLGGDPFVRLGNVLESGVGAKNVLDWFLTNRSRKELLKRQEESKLCNCEYWNLCHHGCVFISYNYEKSKCFDFFRFLVEEAHPLYVNIRKELLKQKLCGYLSYCNNVLKGG